MNPKGALLEKNGYRYNFDRLLYINRVTKKVLAYVPLRTTLSNG